MRLEQSIEEVLRKAGEDVRKAIYSWKEEEKKKKEDEGKPPYSWVIRVAGMEFYIEAERWSSNEGILEFYTDGKPVGRFKEWSSVRRVSKDVNARAY